MKPKVWYKKKKLWVGMITAIVLVLNKELEWNFDEGTIQGLVVTALGLILGEAWIDGKAVKKK